MEKYLVVIEKTANNYSAYSPDVLGCVATGTTVEETTVNMKEALLFHLENVETIPNAKGIGQHISNGIFDEGEVAEEYFITEIEVNEPQHA